MNRFECLSCRQFRFENGEPMCHDRRNATVRSTFTWYYQPPSSSHSCELHSEAPMVIPEVHALAAD